MFEEKNTKILKRSKIISQQPRTFENLNIVDKTSFTIEYPKTSRKLSQTIKQSKRVSQIGSGKSSNSPSSNKTKKKSRIFFDQKNVKITKQSHALKGYASFDNNEILIILALNYNLKVLNLQKNKNKLIDLASNLRGFKLVTTLVLEFKKIQSDDKNTM